MEVANRPVRFALLHRIRMAGERLLNRGLPPTSRITLRIGWPLLILPLVLLNQLLAPHPVWMALTLILSGLYGFGYLWARSQAPAVTLNRHRLGTILVAGDLLEEEFELRNDSRLPVLWAEFVDSSTLPGYQPGRIVACGADSSYQWRVKVECSRRGVFRLGPHLLHLQDPLGLFGITIDFPASDTVLIYPRVVQLPRIALPKGNVHGADRRRRPLLGAQPAATVSEYRPGDSLRHVHWGTTAHRGRLMVKDLELEPSGDIWIVLDLDRSQHSGTGPASTLEFCVMAAASLAAELLAASERRAVGLLAVGATDSDPESYTVLLAPQQGQSQLWQVLAALAPIQAADVPLSDLLASSRSSLGRRGSLLVVAPAVSHVVEPQQHGVRTGSDWLAELMHLKAGGQESSVVLVAPPEMQDENSSGSGARLQEMMALLARAEIPATVLTTDSRFQSVLTFRRRRKVIRSTPTGGVVTFEVEEEVG
jgi:uncharacterized protein (DUF58 family)